MLYCKSDGKCNKITRKVSGLGVTVAVSCAGRKWTGLEGVICWCNVMVGVTYCICHSVVVTLGFTRSDIALEWGVCCGETVVRIFVRMEVGGTDCQCVSVVS